MITKTFRAPVGAGIRGMLVAPAASEGYALGHYQRITVIAPHMEVARQWARYLPDAITTYITPLVWLRRACDDPADLIICDEMSPCSLNQIEATLRSLPCQVWLVNPRVAIDVEVRYTVKTDVVRHPPGTYTCKFDEVSVEHSVVSVTLTDLKRSS